MHNLLSVADTRPMNIRSNSLNHLLSRSDLVPEYNIHMNTVAGSISLDYTDYTDYKLLSMNYMLHLHQLHKHYCMV